MAGLDEKIRPDDPTARETGEDRTNDAATTPTPNPPGNYLEGAQDLGGKHGGQAGVPAPEPRPDDADGDPDVVSGSPPAT
jgi:hypothetical protein